MSENKKKNNKTGIIIFLLIILVAGFIGYEMYFTDNSSGNMRGGFPGFDEVETSYAVYVEDVSYSSMTNYLEFNGDVVASKSIDLYPDVSGKLSNLNVSLGDYVTKGQVVAQIDPSQPGQKYSENPVTSTIDGTITSLPFDIGDTISSTTVPVATVGDLQDLELESYISEKYISNIQLGLDAEITFEAYEGLVFSGSVVEISPVLDSDSRTLEITISLDDNDSNVVKSGMFGSIKLITEVKDNVISIPSSALSTGNDGYFVYVVSDENTAVLTNVETGLEVDGRVEIISGLNEGDKVITRGQSMLQDGSSVKITEK
ncbi:MAG: efflux RND transporter periplasmic adaptor subunit [Sphaerochaetaceae bacterium]|nr:efflux RND transporter periplasmic adaptor subunit [Sphaerochaetaceae bacterium]MDC7248331.1 efflux RND transporter periplasmic adaptor subunit [Sphaerochaetaceae bacterium]